MADTLPVLFGEAQVHRERFEVLCEAGHSPWIGRAVMLREALCATSGLGDGCVSWLGVDVVEDRPERCLDLGLGL